MDTAIQLLLQYKYIILLPLAMVEGPVIAVVAGLLCSRSILNPFYVYSIIVCSDLLSDTFIYILGKQKIFKHPSLIKAGKYFISETGKAKAQAFLRRNSVKAIVTSKLVLGAGIAGIFAAGRAGIPYLKFIKVCTATSALQYIVYITCGYLFGQFINQVSDYLNYFAAFTIAVAFIILLFFFIKQKLNKA